MNENLTKEEQEQLTNWVSRMESGENKNPTLKTLQKVAKAFGVSDDELIN